MFDTMSSRTIHRYKVNLDILWWCSKSQTSPKPSGATEQSNLTINLFFLPLFYEKPYYPNKQACKQRTWLIINRTIIWIHWSGYAPKCFSRNKIWHEKLWTRLVASPWLMASDHPKVDFGFKQNHTSDCGVNQQFLIFDWYNWIQSWTRIKIPP